MKKFYMFIIFSTAVFLVLAACQQNKSQTKENSEIKLVKTEVQDMQSSRDGITVSMEKEKYKTTDNTITLNIQNNSGTELNYSSGFSLEKKINSTWFYVPIKEGRGVDDMGHRLPAKKTKSETYSLDSLRDKLSPGKYRLIQNFGATYLAAPFEVVEP
ncbi:immunoglobulin-like domain-containing protein [Pseudobacillus wudalianchiensis]|uniref:Bacterial Ig-like domain-containing protein n=1 Tax=Pseudobacillus wudalianchiensis TaxID=1743143 RepID=A0A1B9B915_9BACI|nr:immunoglobulin-like domain-containing protein [Bacillus wudalianchiensis]OCA92573.1 hypothetical protein A8F95_02435 [Bacillus wudalianchiensis]